jgi:uncharacterized C2H2 Zn-finger protein
MLKCPQCGKFFRKEEEIIKHIAEVHKNKIPHLGRTRNIV